MSEDREADYQIVSSMATQSLSSQVMALVSEGYEPQGGVAIGSHGVMVQAMYRRPGVVISGTVEQTSR